MTLLAKAQKILEFGGREFHIVGALDPDLSFDWHIELLRALAVRFPWVTLKAYTAVEIDFFARQTGLSVTEVLARLRAAGLQALAGGGAEIFNPEIRRALCPEKIDAERWLAIHGAAHRLGLPSTATLLYGHIESEIDWVDHLLALRALQDQTGGFLAFIPLAFNPENTPLNHLHRRLPLEHLRLISLARLVLQNFDHIKSYHVMVGAGTSQLALLAGADCLDGTVVEEKIGSAAGAPGGGDASAARLRALARGAGQLPIERDTFYNEIASDAG